MSKKSIITVLIAILAILGLAFAYGRANSLNPTFLHESPGEEVCAIYPYENGILQVGDSLRFRIDTGSLVSIIRPQDIELMKRRGVPIDSMWFPSLAQNIFGKTYVTTKRYLLSLPVKDRRLVIDSLNDCEYYSRRGKVINRIMGLAFLSADPNDSVSTLGIDVLEHFVVEYQITRNAVILRKRVPADYQFVSDIRAPYSLMRFLGNGGKYYLSVTTDQSLNDYRIDTGIEDLDLKLPSEDAASLSSNRAIKRTVHTTRGSVSAQYIDSLWVRLGNRQGSHSAYFSPDGDEKYAINPINFYKQDFLIDFPNRKLYLHPTAKLQ